MTAVRRALGIPVTLLVAVLVQVTMVNRAPLPGNTGPDVVLLTVTALGAMLGPMTGLAVGFFAGLALDIAPPAGHLAGEYALVFCLAGYACGRLRDFADPMREQSAVTTVTVMAIGAAGGEVGKAVLGLMLSDPDATGPAIAHVLPGAIGYNLLLAPLVLWLTARAVRRPERSGAPDPHRTPPRTASDYGAVRSASAGAAPRLRLGGASLTATQAPVRREPKLRLGGGKPTSSSQTGGGASPAPVSPGGRKAVPVNFSGSGLLSGLGARLNPDENPLRGLAGKGPGKGWLRTRKPGGATGPARGLAGKGPGKGWLRNSSGPGASALRSASASPGKGATPGRGWLRPARPVKEPRRSSPGRGWLKTGGTTSAWRPKSPGKGWLNGSGGFSARGIGGSGLKGGRRSGLGAASAYRRRRGPRMGGRR